MATAIGALSVDLSANSAAFAADMGIVWRRNANRRVVTGHLQGRGRVAPASLFVQERFALYEIASGADFILVDGQTYLLAPVSPPCIDALAAIEAGAEDMEPDSDNEPDDDDAGADEPSFPAHRPMLPIGRR